MHVTQTAERLLREWEIKVSNSLNGGNKNHNNNVGDAVTSFSKHSLSKRSRSDQALYFYFLQ